MREDEGGDDRDRPGENSSSPTWAEMFDDWLVGKRSFCDWFRKWVVKRQGTFPDYLNALFAFLLASFAFLAWIDAKDAANKTQIQLRLLKDQQRPWLYVASAEIEGPLQPITIDGEKQLMLPIKLSVKNIGKTPALAVGVSASLHYLPSNNYTTAECHDKRQLLQDGELLAVFPSDIQNINLNYLVDDVSLAAWKNQKTHEGRRLYFGGCIFYKTDDTEEIHQTDFIYRMQVGELEFIYQKPFPTETVDTRGVELTSEIGRHLRVD